MSLARVLLHNDDGALCLSAGVGHPQDPATDFAPSTGFYAVSR